MSTASASSMGGPAAARISPLSAWLSAFRPKTLTAAFIPVVVGSALAFGQGKFDPLPALVALLGAVLIQIGTNLTNDYYDFKKGADTHERMGPVRATQSGLLSPRAVLTGAGVSFGLAVAVGMYLVWLGGWPILLVGLLSVLCGYAYTGGPFPLGYHGLGDLFVFLFFGLVAVNGTYWVQAHALHPAALWTAIPVGTLGTAIIVVNNQRDVDTDVKAGKRTLAVRFGVRFAQLEYLALLAAAFAVPPAMVVLKQASPWVLLSWAALPLALSPVRLVLNQKGPALNAALHQTARLQAVFGLLFAAGLLF